MAFGLVFTTACDPLDDINADIESTTTELDTCTSDLAAANAEIDSLNARIEDITDENAALIATLTEEEQQALADLNAQLDDINSQIDDQNEIKSDLTSEIAESNCLRSLKKFSSWPLLIR